MSFDFWVGFAIGSIFPGAAFLAGLVWGWFKYFSRTVTIHFPKVNPGTKEQLEKMAQAIKRDIRTL